MSSLNRDDDEGEKDENGYTIKEADAHSESSMARREDEKVRIRQAVIDEQISKDPNITYIEEL